MRLLPLCTFASFLALAACTGTAVINGDDGTGGGGGAAADDDDDDDAADDDDAGQTNPFAGTYAATVEMIGSFNGQDEDVFCEGDFEMVVDEEGAVTGQGQCDFSWGGGDRGGYVFTAAGTVDADSGEMQSGVMGTASSREPSEVTEAELSGVVGDDPELGWSSEVSFGWGEPVEYEGVVN